MARYSFLLLLITISFPVLALDELVDSTWLKANMNANNLFLLDIQQPEHYRRFHISGAVNAPYVQWRSGKKSNAPGMLLPMKQMEQFLGKLGISNDSVIVIIATGNKAADMAAASRVFWTLKVLGHKKVSVLNGGLLGYAYLYAGDIESIPRLGVATSYKATLDTNITANAADIQLPTQEESQLLDARTLGEFVGVITAKPNERPGTIPGAKHLPFDWFVDTHGHIRDKNAVATLFNAAGLNSNYDGTIHFCHSGNRASLTWFVDYAILGNRNAKLYDASMSEWAAQEGLPIEARIDLKSSAKSSNDSKQR